MSPEPKHTVRHDHKTASGPLLTVAEVSATLVGLVAVGMIAPDGERITVFFDRASAERLMHGLPLCLAAMKPDTN